MLRDKCSHPHNRQVTLYLHKVCSKKQRTFAIKNLFYILSTVPFKVVPSTGDIPFPTFLPLLECFLERTFSYRAVLLAHFRESSCVQKRPNCLNSSPISIEGALRLHVHKLFAGLIRRTVCARAQFSGCSSTTNAHSVTGQKAVRRQNLR